MVLTGCFLGQWDLAHTHFSFTDITLNPSDKTISYYQSLVQEGRRLPVKNPFLAGTLSFFSLDLDGFTLVGQGFFQYINDRYSRRSTKLQWISASERAINQRLVICSDWRCILPI